ncbi:MAG TPA: ParA family protein [Planctomycetota bacterium]|nr:ParA family protein [Planctomycetota bacterium]
MILALINNKGGVAKTTTAVNLAAAIATQKQRVLLVDLDSQAGASLCMGVRRADLQPSVADLLVRDMPIREVIRKTSLENLDLITGSNELAGSDVAMGRMDLKESRLKRVLDPVRSDYAHIIIDCPPSLSLLSVNALLAADMYLVPVTPQVLTISGMASLIEEVNALCERNIGEVAELMGFLLTMVDYRNRTTGDLVNAMRQNWKDFIFKTEIRINVKLAEAPAQGKTIFDYAPQSTGAASYKQFAREFLQRVKQYESGEFPNEQPEAEAQVSETAAANS